MDLTVEAFVTSFLVTWLIGLTPPLVLRYFVFRRPLTNKASYFLCGIFWVINLFIFMSLGSTSKNHPALVFIMLASNYIYTSGSKKTLETAVLKENTSLELEPEIPASHQKLYEKPKILAYKKYLLLFFAQTVFILALGVTVFSFASDEASPPLDFSCLTFEQKNLLQKVELKLDELFLELPTPSPKEIEDIENVFDHSYKNDDQTALNELFDLPIYKLYNLRNYLNSLKKNIDKAKSAKSFLFLRSLSMLASELLEARDYLEDIESLVRTRTVKFSNPERVQTVFDEYLPFLGKLIFQDIIHSELSKLERKEVLDSKKRYKWNF